MQRLAQTFRDAHGLYARIDTFVKRSSVLRVGLVPLASRNQTASVLTALVAEPVQKTRWSEAVAARPLAKDVLITQSANFSYVETHNSLVVYPVPFAGPPVEYLEVNSLTDSWDHLKTCHLLLFVGNDRTSSAKCEFPNLYVVDSEEHVDAGKPTRFTFMGEKVIVDTHKALEANELLQQSPANASKFMQLRSESNISALQSFSVPQVYKALEASIFRSCEQQIAELPQSEAEDAHKNEESRQEWSRLAHSELQSSVLPTLRRLWTHDFAFYKLYARSDDIEPVLSTILRTAMPNSRSHYQFLLGQVSHQRLTSHPEQSIPPGKRLPEHASFEQLSQADVLATSLANQSLKSVLAALSIQLPIAGVSIAGHFLGGFSWYAMSALALLGAISGLRRLQTDWMRATKQFESQVADMFVCEIQQKEQQLWTLGEQSAHEVEARRVAMTEALAAAKAAIQSQRVEAAQRQETTTQ